MKRLTERLRAGWLELEPWQQDMVTVFLVCTFSAAVGYTMGYRDGNRDA